MIDFPDACLRAIQNREWVIEGTEVIDRKAFEPEVRPHKMRHRDDGCFETSIDWEDNEDTLAKTKRNPNAQFGVIRLAREGIDNLIRESASKEGASGILRYERDPLDDNPFHGNILYAPAPKALIQMLANKLAWAATIAHLKPTQK